MDPCKNQKEDIFHTESVFVRAYSTTQDKAHFIGITDQTALQRGKPPVGFQSPAPSHSMRARPEVQRACTALSDLYESGMAATEVL